MENQGLETIRDEFIYDPVELIMEEHYPGVLADSRFGRLAFDLEAKADAARSQLRAQVGRKENVPVSILVALKNASAVREFYGLYSDNLSQGMRQGQARREARKLQLVNLNTGVEYRPAVFEAAKKMVRIASRRLALTT